MRKQAIYISTLAYVAMVIVNVLSELLPIGGVTNAQVSDMYPTLFTPAGFTFSIWGVIYILLGFFVIRQFSAKYRITNARAYRLFSLTSLLNIGWIFAWHYNQLVLSVVIILALLVMLAWVKYELKYEVFLNKAAFSIYFGWISVASIANLFVLCSAMFPQQRGGLLEETFTVIAVVIAGLAAMREIHRNNDFLYALTVLWSFGGIVAAEYLVHDNSHLSIIAMITVMTLMVLRIMIKDKGEKTELT